jgi:hypothetical protein
MPAWIISAVMAFMIMFGGYSLPAPPEPMIISVPDTTSETHEWQEYHALAYAEYADEFTSLYEGYETRWAKNGRLMLRNGDSGPYKFVKRSI